MEDLVDLLPQLVIDAMSELHAGRVDAFCLVSGDGEFTRLAIAIRERGLPVLGFGGDSTPLSLRVACTEFQVLANPKVSLAQQSRPAPQTGKELLPKKPPILRDKVELVDFVRSLIHPNGRTTVLRAMRTGSYVMEAVASRIRFALSLQWFSCCLPDGQDAHLVALDAIAHEVRVRQQK